MKESMPEVPAKGRKKLSGLLPYWGLKLNEDTNRAAEGLLGRSIRIFGLSRTDFAELNTLLRHTGIHLNDMSDTRMPEYSIRVDNKTSSSLAVKAKAMTFTLKPLHEETTDVQTWVHKHLWLPTDHEQLSFIFHTNEEMNIPEWMCYLVIQHFMQPLFRSLSDFSFSEYRNAVTTILEPANPALAARQLSLGRNSREDWPQLPPEQADGKIFNPFEPKSESTGANPIDPFRKQRKQTERATLNPFRKK